jgi:hypothetical protein
VALYSYVNKNSQTIDQTPKNDELYQPEFHLESIHPIAIVVAIIYALYSLINGGLLQLTVGLILGWYAGKNWAPKINGSQTWAFMISYIFPIIGFICYWVYYKHKLGTPDLKID